MLDLKKLNYLAAIHKYGSFTQASKELYVSQPAISAAITSLEKQLGVDLLIRNSKSVTFTPAGERFMIYTEHILQECSDAEQEMKRMAESYDHTLRLGLSPSLSHHLLPFLYETFFPKHRDAHIQLFEGTMTNHITMVRDGSLDVTYNGIPDHPVDDIICEKIGTTQIYAMLPHDHPLTKQPKIDIEMLNGEAVSLPDRNSKVYRLMVHEFQRYGVVPREISYHDQIICMLDMVKYGNYICFVNESTYRTLVDTNPELVARPMTRPITFDVGFIMRKDVPLPKIGRELIEYAKKTSAQWLERAD